MGGPPSGRGGCGVIFRDRDEHGSGAYRAKRGSRLHNGVGICCSKGDAIRAVSAGRVTKIGYPYAQTPNPERLNDELYIKKFEKKKALRYVQVTDENGLDVRYFYIKPQVAVNDGDMLRAGSLLGYAQGLAHIYPRITEHYHFEVLSMVNRKKVFSDPEQYLKAVGAL